MSYNDSARDEQKKHHQGKQSKSNSEAKEQTTGHNINPLKSFRGSQFRRSYSIDTGLSPLRNIKNNSEHGLKKELKPENFRTKSLTKVKQLQRSNDEKGISLTNKSKSKSIKKANTQIQKLLSIASPTLKFCAQMMVNSQFDSVTMDLSESTKNFRQDVEKSVKILQLSRIIKLVNWKLNKEFGSDKKDFCRLPSIKSVQQLLENPVIWTNWLDEAAEKIELNKINSPSGLKTNNIINECSLWWDTIYQYSLDEEYCFLRAYETNSETFTKKDYIHNYKKESTQKLIEISENKNDHTKENKSNAKSYRILRSQIRDKFYNAKKRCNEEFKKIIKGFNDYVEKSLETSSDKIVSDTEIPPSQPAISLVSRKELKLNSHRRANSLATHQRPQNDLIMTTATKIPEKIYKKGKNNALTARLKNSNKNSCSTKEFLNALTALVIMAQTIIDTPGFEILSNPQKCQKYITKIQYYGSKWESNKEWPCKKLYLRFLLAIAALNRISEWWYEEKNKKSSTKMLPENMNSKNTNNNNSLDLFVEQSSPYIVDDISNKYSSLSSPLKLTKNIKDQSHSDKDTKPKSISPKKNIKNYPKVDSVIMKYNTKNFKIQYVLDKAKILGKNSKLIGSEADSIIEFENKIKLKDITEKLHTKTKTNTNNFETYKIKNFEIFGQEQLNADLMIVSYETALLHIYPFELSEQHTNYNNSNDKKDSMNILQNKEKLSNYAKEATHLDQKILNTDSSIKSHIFCHICEQMISILIFEQHASICSSMHRATMDIQICHDGISELKTNLEHPTKEDIEQFENLGLKEELKYVKSRAVELIDKFLSMLNEYSIPIMDVEDIENHIIKSCSIDDINEFDFLEIINSELIAFFSTSFSSFPSSTNITKYLSTSSKLITSLIDSMVRYKTSVLLMSKTENSIVQKEKTPTISEKTSLVFDKHSRTNYNSQSHSPQITTSPNSKGENIIEKLSRNNSSKSSYNRRSRSQSVSINNIINQPSINDYTIIKPISKGAYGSVYLARKKSTKQYYAIKVLKKSNMVLKNQTTNIKAERLIMMSQPENPFVAKLYSSFQTKDNLYLVMEYLNGGDCASLLKNMGCLEEEWAKSYIAEIIVGIGSLHNSGIAHRDLKPDNLLIDKYGHLKLIDFGLSKIGFLNRQFNQGVSTERKFTPNENSSPILDYIWASSPPATPNCNSSQFHITHTSTSNETSKHSSTNTTRSNTPINMTLNYPNNTESTNKTIVTNANTIRKKSKKFVGTPDYLAPESILGTDLEATIDWWALGVITYEFLYGLPPFNSTSTDKVFEKILLGEFSFPEEPLVSDNAKDFIKKLLMLDPKERLGYNGAEEIKAHIFLHDVDWFDLSSKEPFFVPNSEDIEDTDYFDKRGAEMVNMKDMFPELQNNTKTASSNVSTSPAYHSLKENYTPMSESTYSTSNPNSEFGSFMYKNLPLLEKQNEDSLKKIQPNQFLLRRGPNNARSRKGSIHEMLRPNSISFSENFSSQRPDRSDSVSSKSSIKSDHTEHHNLTENNSNTNKPNPLKILQKRGRTMSTDYIKQNTNENSNSNDSEKILFNNSNLKAFSTDSIEINTKRTYFNFLVADDNPLNRRIMQILLSVIPSNIVSCEDGVEAILYSQKVKYDIIFMDINMPNLDGNNATKFIKLTKNINKNTPVVAIAHRNIDPEFLDFYDMVVDNPITKNVIHKCLNSLLD